MATAQDVLRIAEGEVGYSRWDDPQPGTKYGRWYAGLVGDSYYAESGVPYCAMFASWVFDQTGAKCVGLPGAYCPSMLDAAEAAGAIVAKSQARPGDVVYFDWGGDGEVDHVGIVADNLGGCLETIEGNTSSGSGGSQSNGGVVARRSRGFETIAAIVRPAYGDSGSSAPASDLLDLDEVIGPKTVTKWQKQLKTPVDGVVSGQNSDCSAAYPRLDSVTFEGDGSQLMLRVQQIIGVPNPKGVISHGTICYLQGWLYMRGYEYVLNDPAGILDRWTARAIQESLNKGEWGDE